MFLSSVSRGGRFGVHCKGKKKATTLSTRVVIIVQREKGKTRTNDCRKKSTVGGRRKREGAFSQEKARSRKIIEGRERSSGGKSGFRGKSCLDQREIIWLSKTGNPPIAQVQKALRERTKRKKDQLRLQED